MVLPAIAEDLEHVQSRAKRRRDGAHALQQKWPRSRERPHDPSKRSTAIGLLRPLLC